MPCKAKAEIQANLAAIMETCFLPLLHWVKTLSVGSKEDVLTMSGDGSQGPYGQIPKSKDWFAAALMSPDHDFHCTFRYVITKIPTA